MCSGILQFLGLGDQEGTYELFLSFVLYIFPTKKTSSRVSLGPYIHK